MKSNKVASNFCQKANDFLAVGKYSEALKNYNNCLRFSAVDSAESSDTISTRADIFSKFGLYKTSASSGCSTENSSDTIYNYSENIHNDNSIKCENEKWDFFKLSHPASAKIPFISDCLEVKENDVYGRFIATTKDLLPGDIVIIEEPFYKVAANSEKNQRCAVCLKQNLLNLIPCAKCSTALFCSKQCLNSVIHDYECGKVEESFEKALLQRMFYQSIEICSDLNKLEKLMNQHDPKKTIMDFNLNDPNNNKNLKNRMLATMTLAEREPWSAEAYAKYETVTKELEQTQTEDDRHFLRKYLVHCLKSMTVNFFHFFWSSDEDAPGRGYAICSLAAFFAHSCDPNVDKIDVDNKFVFIARKPIKAGEQLTICYDRYNFLTHGLSDRKEYFNRVYTFDCACLACAKNYPLLKDMTRIEDDFVEPKVDITSFEDMKERYKNNCKYISSNIENYPSYEICTLMNQNNRLLYAMGNLLPF